MTLRTARFILALFLSLPALALSLSAQDAGAPPDHTDADLQFVVILSRHGIRAPMAPPSSYDKYSAAPWPKWDVAPSILTPHGFELVKILGSWDRGKLSGSGLFAASGCADAAHVTIRADNDQRTIETGKALAQGMFPGCAIDVEAPPKGTNDSLFRALSDKSIHADATLARAAILGRIGGDPNHLTEAFRPQLTELDHVLAGCGHVQNPNPHRISILDFPSGFTGNMSHLEPLNGPINLSLTLTENLLLEYTEGMSAQDVGWGCLDGAKLRQIMQSGEAGWDYRFWTPTTGRMFASNLLDHIQKSMEQNVTGKPVAGAIGKPGDRLLVLVGHDSNIAAAAGSLGLDWIIDGRTKDTPPAGALFFEIWRARSDGHLFVRLEYIAQTLEQMREMQKLSPANPPASAPIFVPACSQADMSCSWSGFAEAMHRAIDPAYVIAHP